MSMAAIDPYMQRNSSNILRLSKNDENRQDFYGMCI